MADQISRTVNELNQRMYLGEWSPVRGFTGTAVAREELDPPVDTGNSSVINSATRFQFGARRHYHGRGTTTGDTHMAGRYFEEFSVGQVFEHPIRRTITETDNVLFSTMTHNPASLHLDHEYMKNTEFGKVLVNSYLTLGLIVGISVNDITHGTTVANLGSDEIRFPRPLFLGDTIHVQSEVLEMRESKSRPNNGIVTFSHRGFNQHDELVGICRRTALMLKKPK